MLQAIRYRWLLWYTFKNNIVTGQLHYGSMVLWCCFDLQQMGPAAELEIPWYPRKNNTELSASISHPGTVFIWITPPVPLSNDMTQWVTVPWVLLRENLWVFLAENLKYSGKMRASNDYQRNRILERLQHIESVCPQGVYVAFTGLPRHIYWVPVCFWTNLTFLREDME